MVAEARTKKTSPRKLATHRRLVFEICVAEAGAVAAEDGQKLLQKQWNNSVQPQRRNKTTYIDLYLYIIIYMCVFF